MSAMKENSDSNERTPVTLAFDIYGTLIDTHGVVRTLERLIGERATEFSRMWRDKQLEYSFRRGLMRQYADFSVCIRDSLEYTCSQFDVALNRESRDELLALYRSLPAFADAGDGLEKLAADNHRLFAFSNGSATAVAGLLDHAGLRRHFLDIVSVEEIRSFKPDPAVYHHFLTRSGARAGDAWLVSSNPFDVIGAVTAGLQAAWVRRSHAAVFDPWGIEPTVTVGSLGELAEAIARHAGSCQAN